MQVGFPQKSTFGLLTATEVRTPLINTIGVDLTLQRDGVSKLVCASTNLQLKENIILGSGNGIYDDGPTLLMKGDGAGHIDGLGRIDAVMTSMSLSERTVMIPALACASTQSGTLEEAYGEWECVAADILYQSLTDQIPFKRFQGTVKLEKMTLGIVTGVAGAYVTLVEIVERTLSTGAISVEWTDPFDLGDGSTGYVNREYTPNLTFLDGKQYTLRITTVVPSDYVKVYHTTLDWQLV